MVAARMHSDEGTLTLPSVLSFDSSRVSMMPRRMRASSSAHDERASGGDRETTTEPSDSRTHTPIPHLLTELDENRRLYTSYYDSTDKDEANKPGNLSVMTFPACCMQNVDRIRSLTARKHGRNPTIAACVHWGQIALLGIEDVATLLDLQSDLRTNLPASTDRTTLDLVQQVVHTNFRLQTQLPGSRYNAQIPHAIYVALSLTAQDLGMQTTELAVICICLALAHQPETYTEHVPEMRAQVRRFLMNVRLRRRMAETLQDHITGDAILVNGEEW